MEATDDMDMPYEFIYLSNLGTPEPVTPRKFQRTPCHSDVFDSRGSLQVYMLFVD